MYEEQMREEMRMIGGMYEDELLVWNLIRAQVHAQQALDQLYLVGGPKRGFWYRMTLGRAQSTLINLAARELARKKIV
jgi:hypothetical protein